MASKTTDDDPVVFGDEFVADEILARLPARCAVRCTVLSKRFKELLASTHFWLRHRCLGVPLDLPHAARLCLQYHDDDDRNRKAFYVHNFHVVGPSFVIEHAISMEDYTFYAGTCNGLVLVAGLSSSMKGQSSSSINGVVFNPATKEEARLSLQLPHPAGKVSAWDGGDGLLFAMFSISGTYLYDRLHKAAGENNQGGGRGTRLTVASSLKIEYKQPMCTPRNLWDYQPTLISPASILGDAILSCRNRDSLAWKHELDATFVEMTRKWVVDPTMHMLDLYSTSSG